ncbi:MAG: hypothetical protein L3J71_07430 [Victivallaceae bacterium]|nr:hypothetical protein [Victivallaceae bacterium]
MQLIFHLNITLILERFQLFMQEHHSSKDNSFLEKNGRLLLMSFLLPIINGKGFMFKENVTAEDRKMDLVITYHDQRYVIELKIWRGEKYLSEGLEQLCDYLDSYSLNEGYMLIYNFNKNKQYDTKMGLNIQSRTLEESRRQRIPNIQVKRCQFLFPHVSATCTQND